MHATGAFPAYATSHVLVCSPLAPSDVDACDWPPSSCPIHGSCFVTVFRLVPIKMMILGNEHHSSGQMPQEAESREGGGGKSVAVNAQDLLFVWPGTSTSGLDHAHCFC